MLRVFLLIGSSLFALSGATAATLMGDFALDVPSRGFEEHCGRLEAGEQIRYHYRSSAEVDFNIHYHRGKDVHYPVRELASRSADASFTAPDSDDYCLMWERKGDSAARVEGSVKRARP